MSKSFEFNGRAMSHGKAQSQYKAIPSENLKFQQFIDLLFNSKMPKEDIKFEIICYVQALETSLNDTISEFKMKLEAAQN